METNYERYFGTPEKAAAYLACHTRCSDCELIGEWCNGSSKCKDAINAWLEREANDAD